MKKTKILLFSVLIFTLIIGMLPLVVLANSGEDVSIVKVQEKGYVLYIRKYTDIEFKYAFSNDKNAKENELVYSYSATDLAGNQCAFLDRESYAKLKENPIYMWVKDNDENIILKCKGINFNNSITNENIETIENLTKNIATEISTSKEKTDATNPVREEDVDGVKEISKSGYLKITDSKDAQYYYEMVKVTESEDYATLVKLIEESGNKYNEENISEKIDTNQKVYDLYSKIMKSINWKKVENMEIKQPESTRNSKGVGDTYIVFLKKVDKDEKEVTDIQVLQEYYDYESNSIKEEVKRQEISKLPITYDSVALIVMLIVVVAALIVTFIMMKRANKKNEI